MCGGDAVAVLRTAAQRREDEEVEGALERVRFSAGGALP